MHCRTDRLIADDFDKFGRHDGTSSLIFIVKHFSDFCGLFLGNQTQILSKIFLLSIGQNINSIIGIHLINNVSRILRSHFFEIVDNFFRLFFNRIKHVTDFFGRQITIKPRPLLFNQIGKNLCLLVYVQIKVLFAKLSCLLRIEQLNDDVAFIMGCFDCFYHDAHSFLFFLIYPSKSRGGLQYISSCFSRNG